MNMTPNIENLMPEHAKPNAIKGSGLPTSYGMLLFPGFQALDVFGTLDVLNLLSSLQFKLTLSLIASTLDAVSTASPIVAGNPMGSTFHQSVVPTHTFTTAPPLDVLIVPGGVGTRAPGPALDELRAFIKSRYPTLMYFMTICTGSALAAQTGVLDGKKATSNKCAWKWVTAQGPKVDWVPVARWTVDGNVWTSSGVAAGIDAIFAFVETVYGGEAAENIVKLIEYDRHLDPAWDPWAKVHGVEWPLEKVGNMKEPEIEMVDKEISD